jgi:hypothetical protein
MESILARLYVITLTKKKKFFLKTSMLLRDILNLFTLGQIYNIKQMIILTIVLLSGAH